MGGAKRAGPRREETKLKPMNGRASVPSQRSACASLLRSKAKSTTHGRQPAVTVITSSLGGFWTRITHPKARPGATRGTSARLLPLEGGVAFLPIIPMEIAGVALVAGLAVPSSL